jgi:hypothetical protein
MSAANVIAALAELDAGRWVLRRMPYPRSLLADAIWPSVLAVCIVRADGVKAGHLLVWDGSRVVYDPDHPFAFWKEPYMQTDGANARLIGTITKMPEPDKVA